MRVLVTAKAPVAGRVKTRLAATVGVSAAAEVAAASLLDTLEACAAAVGPQRCHLAVDGDLLHAVRGPEILALLEGWTVTAQRGEGFAARLVAAHLEAGDGPVAQVGMDTPQLTASHLAEVFTELVTHDAVLGPADDGGWWVLARRTAAHVRPVGEVAMSEPTTHAHTRAALAAQGLEVGSARVLRDVDTAQDADAVAALVPWGRFAQAWADAREKAAGQPVPVVARSPR